METVNEQPAVTIERAAELSGSTPASIKRAKPIVQSGIPELQDMVAELSPRCRCRCRGLLA